MNPSVKRYIATTFIATWTLWGLLAWLNNEQILQLEQPLGMLLFFLGGFSSTLFAYIIVFFDQQDSFKAFSRRIFHVKVRIEYYVYAIFVPIGLIILGQLIYFMIEGQGSFDFRRLQFASFPLFLFSALIFGGIEEFGWRGILQHHLHKSHSLFVMNLVIGTIWAFWHLPFFFNESLIHSSSNFFIFLVSCIGYSAYLTLLYAKTKSVLLTVIFHTMINALGSLGTQVPLNEPTPFLIYSAILLVSGSFLLISIDKKGKVK